MPRIYLSPSLQEYNPFYGGGSEEEVMNLIADAMEPYLAADGIEYLRNAPEMTLGQAIADSNNSNVDFHLAIHSNAAPPSVAGHKARPCGLLLCHKPLWQTDGGADCRGAA